MRSRTVLSTTLTAALLSTCAALPTRSHCRCTVITTSSDFTPSSLTSSTTSIDACTPLGTTLSSFRNARPDAYSEFISSQQSSSTSASISDSDLDSGVSSTMDTSSPLSTTLLLHLASRHGFQSPASDPSAPSSRPEERIVCVSEPEVFPEYQDSALTLLALQIIVGIAVLACVAEGVNCGMVWMGKRSTQEEVEEGQPHTPVPRKAALRLSGDERLLRAFVADAHEQVFSPGAEKKLRHYESKEWSPMAAVKEGVVFVAYEGDEDDEMSRPVM